MASVANPFDVLEPVETRQSRRRKARRGGGGGGGKDSQGGGGSAGGTPTAGGRTTAAPGKGSARSGRADDGSAAARGGGMTGAPSSTAASVPSTSGAAVQSQHQGAGGGGGDRDIRGRGDGDGMRTQSGSGLDNQAGSAVAEEDSDGRWEVVRESSGKGSNKQGGGGPGAGTAGTANAGALGSNLNSSGAGGGGVSSATSAVSNAALTGAAVSDGSRSRSDLQPSPAAAEIERLETMALACAEDDKRVRLWREWARRASEAGPAGVRGKETAATATYAWGDPTTDSSRLIPVTWKEVFLLSRALEITIEGCFSTPFKPAHQAELEALLCALFPPACEPRMLSPLVADIVGLITSEPVKIVNSAKLAVCSTVAALKGATGLKERLGPGNNTDRLDLVDAEIAECEQRLRQLTEGGEQVSTLNERARCSWEVLQLRKARLDLVLASRSESATENLRSVGVKEPNITPTEVLNFIESLSGAVTEQSLAESAKFQQQQAAAKKGDGGRGRAQAQLADLRKQMTELGNVATDLTAKIRAAEETLVKLRTELASVEARRATLQEQYRQKAASGGSGARSATNMATTVPCTQVPVSLQKHGAQLSAVHALKNYVLRTQKSWAERDLREGQDAAQSMESAVGGYLQALVAHLRNKQHQQQEVKQRLRFCLEKMVPLETEMHQLVQLKKTMLANELVKPLQRLQKMQKEWLEEEECIMSNINSVAEMLQSPSMTTAIGLPGAHTVHEEIWQRLTTAIHQMRNEHDLIMGAASAEISVTPIGAHLPYGCVRGVASTEALSALLSGTPGMDVLSNVSVLSAPTTPPTPHTTPVSAHRQIVMQSM